MGDLELWLVNDDPAQLMVQKRLLGRFAATVWDFQSPAELMDQARKYGRCPNLVSDLHMPHMNGLELSQLWCQMHPNAKILLLSASHLTPTEQDEATYLPTNRVKVLTNFRIPELLSTARSWFGNSSNSKGSEPEPEAELASSEEPSECELEYFSSEMLSSLKKLGGNAFVRKALLRFAERVPRRFASFEEYFEDRNRAAVQHEAHSLKGSCGIVGANRMWEAADQLERAAHDGAEHNKLLELHSELKKLWDPTHEELEKLLKAHPE